MRIIYSDDVEQLMLETIEEYSARAIKILKIQKSFMKLIYGTPQPTYEPFDILANIPNDINISDKTMKLIQQQVIEFNENPYDSIETNGSIDLVHSVHNLWGYIMQTVRADAHPVMKSLRVVYQWRIPHPLDESNQEKLDFTFIPAHISHLNWLDFAGGLEVKNNPLKTKSSSGLFSKNNQGDVRSTKSSSSKSITTDIKAGIERAIARAAMCVYGRWTACRWTGMHVASCYFAYGLEFGVSRVRLNADFSIIVDVSGPFDLPGYNHSVDNTVLRILKHILTSPSEELADLMSPPLPMQSSDEISGLLVSNSDSTEEVVKWTLGSFLGAGAFATVYASGDDPAHIVIKMAPNDSPRLETELKCLNTLATCNLDCFPRVIGALSEDNRIVGLQLSPRGVTIARYLNAASYNHDITNTLLNAMGPVIVRALQAAHVANIAHADSRQHNILVIPSEEDMMRIALACGDISSEGNALRMIQLSVCKFVLNDWGEAIQLDDMNRETRSVEDLLRLVKTVNDTWGVTETDSKDLGRKRKRPSTAFVSKTYSKLSECTVKKLTSMANTLDYNGLFETLQVIRLI